jgi:RNA polymerase sigma factor (sigma-70 family)
LDPALIRRAQRGDVEAFTELIAERIEPMARTAMAIIGQEADARDAVQEALASIWRSLPRLRDPARYDAWSTRILVNASRRIAGRRGARGIRELAIDPDDEAAGISDRRGSDSPEDQTSTRDALERAFDRLDVDARSLLVLHHLDERTVSAIASILGVPEGTVKSRLHKARSDLARYLALEER